MDESISNTPNIFQFVSIQTFKDKEQTMPNYVHKMNVHLPAVFELLILVQLE
jgi:hypothetical protein